MNNIIYAVVPQPKLCNPFPKLLLRQLNKFMAKLYSAAPESYSETMHAIAYRVRSQSRL